MQINVQYAPSIKTFLYILNVYHWQTHSCFFSIMFTCYQNITAFSCHLHVTNLSDSHFLNREKYYAKISLHIPLLKNQFEFSQHDNWKSFLTSYKRNKIEFWIKLSSSDPPLNNSTTFLSLSLQTMTWGGKLFKVLQY